MTRNILGGTNLANHSMEQKGGLAVPGLGESSEVETIIHQATLRTGHQLVLVVQLTRQSYQAVVGSEAREQ